MAERRPALGKGLGALIPDAPPNPSTTGALEIEIDRLEPNDLQPRSAIPDDRLQELAQSIKANGIIQPIVVRPLAEGRYQIIAGERRWRAARQAGLSLVPVVVRSVSSKEQQRRLEMALIENIQRENLNPIEEALAYQRLVGDFGLSQEAVAAQVGKDRSSVANTLRLLRLPEEVRAEVASGRLSMGHARAILGAPDDAARRTLARAVVNRGLSVRETEAMARPGHASSSESQLQSASKKDVHTRAAEEQLKLSLGTAVEIRRRGTRGILAITFTSEDELQRLYEYLTERR